MSTFQRIDCNKNMSINKTNVNNNSYNNINNTNIDKNRL